MRAAILALLCFGCSSAPEPSAAPSPPPEGLPEPTTEVAVVPPLDPASDCGRARACCEAFADSVPSVHASSACVGPEQVAQEPDADSRCARMRDGWRAALEHHPSASPPDACR